MRPTAVNALEYEDVPTRQDGRLYLPINAGLPPFCIQCGVPTEVYKIQEFTGADRDASWLLLIGVISLQKVTVPLPLCPRHMRRSRFLKLFGVLLIIAAVPLGLVVGDASFSWAALVGLIGGVGVFSFGCVLWSKSEVLSAKRIGDYEIVLSGAAEEFLTRLKLRATAANN